MADLAKYIRIFDPAPEDDNVSKRETAIAAAITQLRKTNDVTALVGLGAAAAQAFVDGVAPDPLGSTVAASIKKQASAFVREERELETAVLSAVAVMGLLEGTDAANSVTTKDIIGATLWSALSYQKPVDDPKLEQLRQDLLKIAGERVVQRAEIGRKRTVPSSIPAVPEGDAAQLGKSLAAATNAVLVLQTNAALDREEIDVLWWALGGRSPTTGVSYDSMPPAVRAAVRGVELGIQLRRLPSRAHRSLALSGVGETEPLTLRALVKQLSDVRESLSNKIPARLVLEANVIAFPLLTAILAGKAATAGPAKTVDEWCARAVLESGLASLCENPAPRL